MTKSEKRVKIYQDENEVWHVVLGNTDVSQYVYAVAMQVTHRGAQVYLELGEGMDVAFYGLAEVEASEPEPPEAPLTLSEFTTLSADALSSQCTICDCVEGTEVHSHYVLTFLGEHNGDTYTRRYRVYE